MNWGYTPFDTPSLGTGWSLLGAGKQLSSSELLSKGATIVWSYKNGNWSQNPTTIETGDGFWVNAKSSPSPSSSATSSLVSPAESECTAIGGTWISSYNECAVLVSSSATIDPNAGSTANTTPLFSKPTQSQCTAGGGSWNSSYNECEATWDKAMRICSMPSKDKWLSVFASCGADIRLNSVGYYGDDEDAPMRNCMEHTDFVSKGHYWSSSLKDSSHTWSAYSNHGVNWHVNGWEKSSYAHFVRCDR